MACRYATHLVAMAGGAIVAEGTPSAVVTPALIERLYGIGCRVIDDPETGTPLVVPARTTPVPVAR
jgi:ABC-type cobalamin/Fe3+-siderophores transport system ATPase subunit